MNKIKKYLGITFISIGLVGCASGNTTHLNNLEVLLSENNPILQDVMSKYIMEKRMNNEKCMIHVSKQDLNENGDGLQKLSTQILSGNTPDILDLTYLPYDKYTQKGVLQGVQENRLNELLPQYDEAISKSFIRNNEIYAFPFSVEVPVIAINKKMLAEMGIQIAHKQYTLDHFIRLLNELNEKKPEGIYLLPKDSSDYLLTHMLKVYYYTYRQYPKETQRKMLEKIFEVIDEVKRYEHPQFDRWMVQTNSKGEKNQVLLLTMNIDSYSMLMEDYAYIPMLTLGKEWHTLYANNIVGLGMQEDDRKEKQEAFLSYAFSEDVQYRMGFARRLLVTNTKAREGLSKFHLQKYPELKENVSCIEDMIKQTDLVMGQDIALMDIKEQVGAYLYDHQSKEKTIEALYKIMIACE